MKLQRMGGRRDDVSDPLNVEVLSDESIGVCAGVMMRRVRHQNSVSGEEFSFITSYMDFPE